MPATKTQLKRWHARAETLHAKAASLFGEIEDALGEDDKEWVPWVGDTMVSADELRNMLEAAVEETRGCQDRSVKDPL